MVSLPLTARSGKGSLLGIKVRIWEMKELQ